MKQAAGALETATRHEAAIRDIRMARATNLAGLLAA